jgi:hypothetical protein
VRLRRVIAVVAGLAALPAAAGAAVPPERALRASVSATGGDSNGPSRRPDFSTAGRLVVFESAATNLAPDPNGAVWDIFERDLQTGLTRLVSAPPDGSGANGDSGGATVATSGGLVVFESAATNLGPLDTNRQDDVYARPGGGAIQRVSVTATGAEPNGRSFEPDVSADGRFVVFTSLADNIVPGDANRVEDVFVRDMLTGSVRRVSQPRGGGDGDGRSRAPAISPDGGWVSFHSTAGNLIRRDTNDVADVFLANLRTGGIRRVSVSSDGRQQNAAVQPPFFIVSDVSREGRFVAFDSDATNLVRGDTNRDTDVFVRDVPNQTTERVSRTVTDRQADNDSYFPTLSPDGRFVGFSSFAGNIWPRDRDGEDVFLHDRELDTTTILTARETGRPRGPELVKQLLRRPAISFEGDRIGFTSTSSLVPGDGNRLEDVFVRSSVAPQGHFIKAPPRIGSDRRPRIQLGADDPTATTFVCRLDGRVILCPRNGRLPRLDPGRHTLKVRAGGPGMRFDPTPLVRRFRIR